MMMMQGILPALDPDAMLNLAISLSIQDGVIKYPIEILCVRACVRAYTHECMCYQD